MSITRALLFFAVVIGIDAGIHYYLWVRLVRDPAWPAPWGSVGTWVVIALAASIPLAFVSMRLVPREVSGPLSWVAFVWMGLMFLLVVLLLPAEIVRFAGPRLAPDELASPERRELLARGLAGLAGVVTMTLAGVSMASALASVKVQRVRVPLRDLPEPLRGFKIVQLTDIHVGPTIGKSFIEELVETTNGLDPDVIAITGDLIDGTVADLGDHVRPLSALRARHGVFFVTGNHEYYSGADEWMAFLGTLGIRVLANERVTIEHDGAHLDLAGVHDWESRQFGHGPDLERALGDRAEGRKLVLLAHQPKQIESASALGVDLQISGHTHGGQIMPFNYLVRLQQPYVAGLHDHAGTKLYVSRGTGYWGPPMRLGIPAEITHIELA
jgi:predicted MPP superfamily phosphohydrolase